MRKCIHLVEDNKDIGEIIQFILEEEGIKVSLFHGVKSFKKTFHQHLPDLFIFDVNLPDGNGIELCKEVKSDLYLSEVPVLMLSANVRSEAMAENSGADAFLGKPFDLDVLIKLVKNLLKNKEAQFRLPILIRRPDNVSFF